MNTFDIPVPDGILHARSTGSGPPLVMVHGGALDHTMWNGMAADLGSSHHVVTYDARGHGDSSTPTAPFRHADDLMELLAALELESAVLIGLSLGASTALDVAVEHPERVAGLVLIGAGAGAHPHEFRDPWMQQVFRDWSAAGQRQDPDLWVDAFLRIAVGAGRAAGQVDPRLLSDLRRTALRTIARHVRPEAVPPTITVSTRTHLEDLRMPVLAVHGREDSADHHRMASEVAQAAGRGREVTLDDTAHYPPLERPEAFTAALRAWLADIGMA